MNYIQLIEKLKNKIALNSNVLRTILLDYQAQKITDYEIERCIKTFNGLSENHQYLNVDKQIDSIAIMLPSNLPLYSLVVFAVIPSILCKSVNVRPNSILQEHDIISRIADALELEQLFPGIKIINEDHVNFKPYIKNADLVVFTGKPSNADKILKEMKENSLLVINGAGHNPLVITETADVDKAIEDAVMVKGFNGGQDCAGPDAILVHADIANKFISNFQMQFSSLVTGTFQNIDTDIGPINRFSELQRLSTLLHQNKKDIVSGGIIDFKTSLIYPTTIVRDIERYPNFKEVYGPVAFIHTYKCDNDLAHYFQDMDGQYNANRMYVSLYGNSIYISERDDSINPGKPGNIGIVLNNQLIHDVEIGYKPYGGYSMGASGIIKKSANGTERVAMPILLPQIIVEYIIENKELPCFINQNNMPEKGIIPSIKKNNEMTCIIEEFHTIVREIFNENLVFGFIFGSAAKGTLKTNKDDLDTFICIKQQNHEAIQEYNRHLVILHKKHSLKVDEIFPSEVLTLETLENAIEFTSKYDVSVDNKIEGNEYNYLFWIHAITDKKIGFIGNSTTMHPLIRKAQPNIYRWKEQIMSQLTSKNILPDYLYKTFSGLSRDEILDKLSRYSAHLIIHLGLNYATESASPKIETLDLKMLQASNGFFAVQQNRVTNTNQENKSLMLEHKNSGYNNTNT